MLDWLRRRICRCPETPPLIENTGFTGTLVGFSDSHDFGEAVSYQAEGSITPTPTETARSRHLHAVPDPTE